jgi:hypothetical protein
MLGALSKVRAVTRTSQSDGSADTVTAIDKHLRLPCFFGL